MSNLLELQNLHVSYRTPRGTVQAVRGVDLTLQPGEVLAIVGESGCGKSALCKAIMRLLPDNADIEGRILVNGTDIAPYPEKELQKLRGRLFSMVFQDPMTALNPSMTIGAQIAEAVLVHEPKISRDALRARGGCLLLRQILLLICLKSARALFLLRAFRKQLFLSFLQGGSIAFHACGFTSLRNRAAVQRKHLVALFFHLLRLREHSRGNFIVALNLFL